MNAMQQHLLDSYRAAQRGEVAPPIPDAAIVRTAREIRQWRRFQAVVTDPAERWWGRKGRLARRGAAWFGRGFGISNAGPAAPSRPAPAPSHPAPAHPTPETPHVAPKNKHHAGTPCT
ncbi:MULTISPECIES: hypothetical protein [unclassified Streptomyces]|uniref:hypothetical protein n=1 Tax=unclassified Streptomyces TaxID=2593676 RepID=UPI0003782F53|nr:MULTISPECIES: hypothetical protein [unclassified Streptomyces]